MNYHISLEAAKQLKEWGCDVESTHSWSVDRAFIDDEHMYTVCINNSDAVKKGYAIDLYPAYDLRDIICNGEMAKAFFGTSEVIYGVEECAECSNTHFSSKHFHCPNHMAILLKQNRKQEAEEYLLEHTIFNPKNK